MTSDPAEPSNAMDGETVTALLERMADGDLAAGEALFPVVYRQLHDIAHNLMSGERRGHTLQTTALVHEAWLRLKPTRPGRADTRIHFLGLATRAMRRVLIDHARKRGAKKRDGGQRHDLLDDALAHWHGDTEGLLALDEALDRLDAESPELRRVVELRFFGGLTLAEVGAVLDMSIRQVHRRWTLARGWLRLALDDEAEAR